MVAFILKRFYRKSTKLCPCPPRAPLKSKTCWFRQEAWNRCTVEPGPLSKRFFHLCHFNFKWRNNSTFWYFVLFLCFIHTQHSFSIFLYTQLLQYKRKLNKMTSFTVFFLLVISSQVLQLKYETLRETILDQTRRWRMCVFLHMWLDLNAPSHKFSLILKCVTLQREKRSFVFHVNFKGMENDCDCDSSWTRNVFLLTACLT